jgi:hypothetical protein
LAVAVTQANEEKAVLYEQSQQQLRKRKINSESQRKDTCGPLHLIWKKALILDSIHQLCIVLLIVLGKPISA